MSLPVTLREATPADASNLLTWRNDRATREASFSSAEISMDRHVAWLESKLADRNASRLWVALAGEAAVGTARVDRLDAGTAEVHIAVAPQHRGRGLAAQILRAVLDEVAAVRFAERLHARVKSDNEASLRAFRSAGFSETGVEAGIVSLSAPAASRPGGTDGLPAA
jgi:RimJ/RimL family protein N-acetyltransferase